MNDLAILLQLLKESGVSRYKDGDLEIEFDSVDFPVWTAGPYASEPSPVVYTSDNTADPLYDHLGYQPTFPDKK